jgi:uncharacterized protein YndB with AHSA1/START domain
MDREFTVERTLNAPPELVFRAWTDAAELEWFRSGTETDRQPIEVDLRVGGAFRVHMVVDEDLEYVTGGVYREIVPNERLVFVWGAVGGWPDLSGDGINSSPVVTLTFAGIAGGQTAMTLHSAIPADLPDEAALAWMQSGMYDGWSVTIDRLVERFAGTV